MLEYLEIGIITSTHGIKGELKVLPWTDDPMRYKKLKEIYLENNKGTRIEYEVKSVRFFKQFVLMTLKGVEDMDSACLLKGCKVVIHRKDAVQLPEDTYFIGDLLGCRVYEQDNLIGQVDDVISTGSNDVYVVKNSSGKEILIPAIGDVILNVDIAESRIDVKLPKGLVDDE